MTGPFATTYPNETPSSERNALSSQGIYARRTRQMLPDHIYNPIDPASFTIV
jgi:hypothetical protein